MGLGQFRDQTLFPMTPSSSSSVWLLLVPAPWRQLVQSRPTPCWELGCLECPLWTHSP